LGWSTPPPQKKKNDFVLYALCSKLKFMQQ
jgi:hypothetical protein